MKRGWERKSNAKKEREKRRLRESRNELRPTIHLMDTHAHMHTYTHTHTHTHANTRAHTHIYILA